MKILKKEKLENGIRNIYFCGYKIFSYNKYKISEESDKNKICIAIQTWGGIGNTIFALEFTYKLRNFLDFNDFAIDFYSTQSTQLVDSLADTKKFIRNSYTTKFKKKFSHYDLIIELYNFPLIKFFDETKIKGTSVKLLNLIQLYMSFKMKNEFLYKGFDAHFLIEQFCVTKNLKRYSHWDIENILGIKNEYTFPIIVKNYDEVFTKFGLKHNKFITIQRGVDAESKNPLNCTKLWSVQYYNELIIQLKKIFPDHAIIQLGISEERCVKLENVDLDLLGKTSFEELKILLKHSFLHIDCECGMVHLRKALKGGVSVVLFGPTSIEFYGYDENINIRNKTGCKLLSCSHINSSWLEKCILGETIPPCINIMPNHVINEIQNHFCENKQ